MRPLLILRPQPGNEATAARAAALGLEPIRCPLFEVVPLAWTAPDPAGFDHLLLTSANAIRHGGDALDRLMALAVLAVGPATAAAARDAGFRVAATGMQGVVDLLDGLPGTKQLLHLAGAEREPASSRHHITAIPVYRAAPTAAMLPCGPLVALVHSPRAGARLAALARDRADISIAAISAAAAAACGTGWAALEWSAQPQDAALLALAARLCQD